MPDHRPVRCHFADSGVVALGDERIAVGQSLSVRHDPSVLSKAVSPQKSRQHEPLTSPQVGMA